MENGTIEERVTLLEIQMEEVQGDVAQNEGDINLLFTGQIIQDERLVDLEDDTSELERSVESQYDFKKNFVNLKRRLLVQSKHFCLKKIMFRLFNYLTKMHFSFRSSGDYSGTGTGIEHS